MNLKSREEMAGKEEKPPPPRGQHRGESTPRCWLFKNILKERFPNLRTEETLNKGTT